MSQQCMHADLQPTEPAVVPTNRSADLGMPEGRPLPSSNQPDYADYIENAEDEVISQKQAQNTEDAVMSPLSHRPVWSTAAAVPPPPPSQEYVQHSQAAVMPQSSQQAVWSPEASVPLASPEYVQSTEADVTRPSSHRAVWSMQAAVPLPQEDQPQDAEPAVRHTSSPQRVWNAAGVIPSSQRSAWSAVAAELSQQRQLDLDDSDDTLQQQRAESHAADVSSLQQVISLKLSSLMGNTHASRGSAFMTLVVGEP